MTIDATIETLMTEVATLRGENAGLREGGEYLKQEVDKLEKVIEQLRTCAPLEPDWSQAPVINGAKMMYHTVGEHGSPKWHADEPYKVASYAHGGQWHSNAEWAYDTIRVPNWEDSLRKRPEA